MPSGLASISPELRRRVEMLAELEGSVDEWRDEAAGPYVLDDGRPAPTLPGWDAPAHHPLRCHGTNTRGRRCKKWSCRGRLYCRTHGGRHRPSNQGRWRMPSIYGKHMMPTLAARLEQFLGSKERAEQLRVYEEVALARTTLLGHLDTQMALMHAREKYREQHRDNGGMLECKITEEHLHAAQLAVDRSLQLVVQLCSTAARIEKDLADKVSVEHIGEFVEDLTRAIHRHLGDDPRAQLIERDLRERVKLPAPEDITVRFE